MSPQSTWNAQEVRDYWERRFADGGVSLATTGWIGLGPAFNAWMYRVRRAHFLETIPRHIDVRACDVLDVGSGSGFYLERWKELGARSITGSDLTEASVERLRNAWSVPIVQLDIGSDVLLIERRFHAISAMDILYHIVDDDRYSQAFRNVADLLEPGGTFVFTENFLHGPTLRAAHQVSRSLDEIRACVEGAGLSIVTRVPVFCLMNTPVDARGRLPSLYWRVLTRLVKGWDPLGYCIGATLYPLERLATKLVQEGPSTELMLCRKPRV